MFCDCCYVSKYFLHYWHCYALSVFFTWIIIYIRLYMSCLWKQFPDEMVHQKTLAKKAPIFFWFQVWDLTILGSFYKSQNFNWRPVCPVLTHWTYTCLSPWALWSCDMLWNVLSIIKSIQFLKTTKQQLIIFQKVLPFYPDPASLLFWEEQVKQGNDFCLLLEC